MVLIVYLTLRHVNVKDADSYLINKRKTKTLPLVFTTLATFVGGGTSMGLIAFGYESGIAAVAIGIAYVIGFFILFRFAGQIHRLGAKKDLYSFPGFLNKSYLKDGSHSLFSKLFSSTISLINIFIFFFLLAAQFVGMATLLEFAFDINYLWSAIISCVVVILYTAFAGLSGVIITDFIQFIVIIIMIILIFIPGVWDMSEGMTRFSELPPKMVNGTSDGLIFLIGVPLLLCWSVIVRMDIWQRIFAAQSEKVARKVSLWSGIGMLPFYIVFPLVGMAVRLNDATIENAKDVPYLFLESNSGQFMLGFAVVGLLSALMSSGDSFLNIISITAVKDFVGWKRVKSTKEQVFKKVRIAVIIFGVVAMAIALSFPNIVDLMVVGVSTISIFVPITLFALIRKDVYRFRAIAFASILAGFVINLIFFTYGILEPDKFSAKSSFIPAFIVATLVLVIGIPIAKALRKTSLQ